MAPRRRIHEVSHRGAGPADRIRRHPDLESRGNISLDLEQRPGAVRSNVVLDAGIQVAMLFAGVGVSPLVPDPNGRPPKAFRNEVTL